MKNKNRIVLGTLLVLSIILPITLFATPTLAINETSTSEQEREMLQNQECTCECYMLQTQNQECTCECYMLQTQNRERHQLRNQVGK